MATSSRSPAICTPAIAWCAAAQTNCARVLQSADASAIMDHHLVGVPTMSTPATALSFRDVLQNSAVKRLWIGQIVSVFGDFLALFAVIAYITFKLHGTPMQVSMIM